MSTCGFTQEFDCLSGGSWQHKTLTSIHNDIEGAASLVVGIISKHVSDLGGADIKECSWIMAS